jgi:heme/copper-type cytochrome/quinol oxidase subunit 2
MSTPETPPSGGEDPGRGLSGIQRASVILGGLAVVLVVFVILRGSGDDGGSSSSSSQTTATQTATSNGTQSTTGSTSTSADSTTSTSEDSTTSTSDDTTPDDSTSTSTSTDTEPAVQTIVVENGKPQGGIQKISSKKGDQVGFKVTSDVADEVHVHGYDLKKDVEAGGSVSFAFEATIEGRFEVELENAGTQIANLEVDPA